MEWFRLGLLALVQGLTEFLPISSSAHLILLPKIAGWEDQGLAFDVAVHVGTLSAVVWYFRHELTPMGRDWFGSLRGRHSPDSRLAWAVLLGTIPVGVAGLAFNDLIELHLRSPLVIAVTTLGFGLLLWWSDRVGRRERDEHTLTWRDVLVVGVAQAIALIPGTSRSGITITAALFMGLDRVGAARFSFLLSIPVIVLAGGLETMKLVRSSETVEWGALALGVVISALSAYLCIRLFIALLQRVGMAPFVIYRLVLGAVLLMIFL
ncbi:MAG: undecaprenyl-diphosphate phosphatase [Proteobacteria bacterium]|nr:MAG: undecaprenyl-diphosphate phosphatase [Pseudomonadota bacterium]QKK10441.1 MAG: undecaprenyl-diphosphate phosphatase [Pseudomonadota bacterium]